MDLVRQHKQQLYRLDLIQLIPTCYTRIRKTEWKECNTTDGHCRQTSQDKKQENKNIFQESSDTTEVKTHLF